MKYILLILLVVFIGCQQEDINEIDPLDYAVCLEQCQEMFYNTTIDDCAIFCNDKQALETINEEYLDLIGRK